MNTTIKSKPKHLWALFYALAAFAVAVTSALVILAPKLPPKLAALTGGIDLQIAVFMVPMAALMLALLAEVLRATLSGRGQVERPAPVRQFGRWDSHQPRR